MSTSFSVGSIDSISFPLAVSLDLSQRFIKFVNGAQLRSVDRKIDRLVAKLNDRTKQRGRRSTRRMRADIALLEGQRVYLKRTMA